jgi:hypothetical protein
MDLKITELPIENIFIIYKYAKRICTYKLIIIVISVSLLINVYYRVTYLYGTCTCCTLEEVFFGLSDGDVLLFFSVII